MSAGSHIVSCRALYGGSHNLLRYTLPRFGVETTFIHPRDLDAWEPRFGRTRGCCSRRPSAIPGSTCLDIPTVAEIAHGHGLPLMVDSTFTTPYLMTPFDHGADLVYHSATKFIGGHGVAIGGVLVDGGTFDWVASGKFQTLSELTRGSTA